MEKVKLTQSAGGIVLNRKGEVLVVSQHGTSWSLPKGHIDSGEDALETAKREIYEESGIKKLALIRELGNYTRTRIGKNGGENKSEKKKIHMFLFKTPESRLKPVDPHNPEARWVTPAAVPKLLTHKKDKQFFQKWLLRHEKEKI